MSTAVRSHAKINLGLYIGAPRPDGFHALTTVYQTLEMHDVVTVSAWSAATTSIQLTSNDGRVPTDDRNTAWKMVALALADLGVKAKVEIHIEKKLPVQGGLGAGSANAVAALVGLEQELLSVDVQRGDLDAKEAMQRSLPQLAEKMNAQESYPLHIDAENVLHFDTGFWPNRKLALAEKVGSDVPLFLVGGAALGRDRGQQVFPLPDFEPVWCVVAIPPIGVSTPQAFKDWDALCVREHLTPEASEDRLEKLSRAYASAFSGYIPRGGRGAGSSGVLFDEEDLAARPQETIDESGLVRTGITSWIENDFERVVFSQHPSLSEIKRLLAATGRPEAALHASLSGSGSALFGLYKTRGDAEAAVTRINEQATEVEARITRTLPRAEYWRQMLLE